jgi:hypothetical protein
LVRGTGGQSSRERCRGDAQQAGLLKAMVTQCSEDLIQKIDTDHRVCCLTPSDENLLMWSHYAENHTGICLRFDTHVEPFLGAFEVSYRNVLPVSTLPDCGTDVAVNALLVKSDVWAYEKRVPADRDG